METEDIQVEVKNRVCWITLNRPKKLNSLTIAMHDSIRSTLDDLDESVKCVVITGSGSRAFSAGADISEIDKLTPEEAENYARENNYNGVNPNILGIVSGELLDDLSYRPGTDVIPPEPKEEHEHYLALSRSFKE